MIVVLSPALTVYVEEVGYSAGVVAIVVVINLIAAEHDWNELLLKEALPAGALLVWFGWHIVLILTQKSTQGVALSASEFNPAKSPLGSAGSKKADYREREASLLLQRPAQLQARTSNRRSSTGRTVDPWRALVQVLADAAGEEQEEEGGEFHLMICKSPITTTEEVPVSAA